MCWICIYLLRKFTTILRFISMRPCRLTGHSRERRRRGGIGASGGLGSVGLPYHLPMRVSLVTVLALLVAIATDGADAQRAPRCHPSYAGACVPIVRGDIDCPRFYSRGVCDIEVVGDDVYRFDGDGNGVGCECASMEIWRRRSRRTR